MAVPPQSAIPFAFGPFEVDGNTPALLKHGVRIRLAGQPLKILLVLLRRPDELITREELCREVWGGETFVDFEHGLNAAVNKLRSALSDSAENPRYIETVPGRGYRFIHTLDAQLPPPGPSAEASSIREQPASGRPGLHWWWLAAIAACAAISFVAGRRVTDVQETLPPWTLTRITADAGLSNAPAISPDGKLVAYSSNSGPEGERDLYVRQTAGGQPVRLTSDGAGNTTPDFSREGNRIVFRSNRDGGGIYEVPALGGEARLIARDGLDPRYSPDGSMVAYWVGAPGVAPAVPGGGSVWVVPRAGGQPQRVGPGFTNARYPIWSPDGKHLLFRGYTSAKAYDGSSIDWWYVSVDGGSSVRTGAYEAFIRAGLLMRETVGTPVLGAYRTDGSPRPGCWLAATTSVVFSVANGDTQNLWETGISSTGKANGVVKRLTSGAGNEQDPSCALGSALVFTNTEVVRNVWSAPFDLDGGRPKGAFDRVTEGPARRENPSLSRDGRYVAFASSQSGSLNIWRRELATGEETHVSGSSLTRRYPAINASGTKVAFSSYEGSKRILYVSTPVISPRGFVKGACGLRTGRVTIRRCWFSAVALITSACSTLRHVGKARFSNMPPTICSTHAILRTTAG